jgi:lipid-binding SYLF domain-containing protein
MIDLNSRFFRLFLCFFVLIVFSGCSSTGDRVDPVASAKISRDSDAALKTLYESVPSSKVLAEKAAGILVFSNIVKAGFIGGLDYGKGELKVKGKVAGYYNFVSGSVGFQAGVQSYDYVLFFMKKSDLEDLKGAQGFEVGLGPSVVAVDAGAAANLTTTTGRADVYSFIYNQRGLMGAVNLEGSKITQITP